MINIKVIKNFLICSFGNLILKIISSLIVFVSILFINPEEYGLLSLANTFMAIFPIFLNLGLRQAFGLDFFHVNPVERDQMLKDIISIYMIISLPVLIFSFFNLSLINKYIFLNKANNHLIFIILIICFLHFFVELLFQLLRYQSEIFKLSALQIFMSIINAIVSIFLLYFSNLKIAAILIGNCLSNIAIFFYGIYLYIKVTKNIKCNIFHDKKKLVYYLKLGFPFIPNIFFNWLISFGDRWVLNYYTGLTDVGIYSFADSFGLLFNLLVLMPINSSYIPSVFENFSKNKTKILQLDRQNIKNMWNVMFFMFTTVTLGFLIFHKFLYLILPEKYFGSIKFIWLILIEQIIFLGSYFASCYLTFFKKTYFLVGLTLFASILNLILNFLLIPLFSIYGCIISSIISYSVYLISMLGVTQYVKTQNISLTRIVTN